jgi:hypothetical protein
MRHVGWYSNNSVPALRMVSPGHVALVFANTQSPLYCDPGFRSPQNHYETCIFLFLCVILVRCPRFNDTVNVVRLSCFLVTVFCHAD